MVDKLDVSHNFNHYTVNVKWPMFLFGLLKELRKFSETAQRSYNTYLIYSTIIIYYNIP